MTDRRSLLRGLALLPAFTTSAALAAIAPEQQTTDDELLTLVAEFLALDAEIERMSLATGDRDLNEQPGYREAEDRRFEAIDAIVALPARTQAGVVAKARMLKVRSVVEDYTATGEISASMAADVLRLHGGTLG